MHYYTSSHEWIDLEKQRVGLSVFAKNELGEIVYLQLPPIGKKVTEGDELCILESTKAAADVYAPYSGIVTQVNPHAIQFINEDPEGMGWLVELKPESSIKVEAFLEPKAYRLLVTEG